MPYAIFTGAASLSFQYGEFMNKANIMCTLILIAIASVYNSLNNVKATDRKVIKQE